MSEDDWNDLLYDAFGEGQERSVREARRKLAKKLAEMDAEILHRLKISAQDGQP